MDLRTKDVPIKTTITNAEMKEKYQRLAAEGGQPFIDVGRREEVIIKMEGILEAERGKAALNRMQGKYVKIQNSCLEALKALDHQL